MAKTPTTGSIGVALRYTCKEDGVAVNIATATTKKLRFAKPSGAVVEKDAAFVTDGSDGKIQYVTVAIGDLDEKGDWRVSAYLVMPGFTGYTLETVMRVK